MSIPRYGGGFLAGIGPDSTEDEEVPPGERLVSKHGNNTRTTALFNTLKALSKLEAGGMKSPCPRPGET